MRDINIAITAASYSGNKGAAAMLQSGIKQLYKRYGHRLNINLMSVYPGEDRKQVPYDFVRIISCKPEHLLFIAFPLAILYRIFGWIPGVKKLLGKYKIIKAYQNTDMVVDMAGISFVDSRGIIMNSYAFVCMAVPMLIGVPVVKYSQAVGPFKNVINRILAKLVLKRCRLICARGEITLENLKGIGISENVKLCADGAFTMEDDEETAKEVADVCDKDDFYKGQVIGISLSSVVNKKCDKLGINYQAIMTGFIDRLTKEGKNVLIIANAARINSEKTRNNDLMICDAVYSGVNNKEKVRWYHKEMTAEEIREYISVCKCIIASRFHTMIGALEKKKPVLLIGWSHKYKEVLDMFELGRYAIDFSRLDGEELYREYSQFIDENEQKRILECIDRNYDNVIKSSYENIELISKIADSILSKPKKCKFVLDLNNPDKYLGEYYACRKGYAAEASVRENAASGGMISAFLVYLLETGKIDGAWVTKTEIKNGELGYRTYIATTKEEILDASSSIYMDMPLLKHIDMLRSFNGRLAVVLTPCMLKGLSAVLEKDEELKKKIVIKLGLYCSGNHDKEATLLSMRKSGISLDNAERLYYRRGHWRGISSVLYSDGSTQSFSYTKTICAYKNAYFFEKKSCMYCKDHYALVSDISFGDIWMKEMKNNPIKHTACIIRNEEAYELYREAARLGYISESHMSAKDAVRSQKRALVFKFNSSEGKKWNHRLARYLAEKNRLYSEKHPQRLAKKPVRLIYYYMCFIRVLLSF